MANKRSRQHNPGQRPHRFFWLILPVTVFVLGIVILGKTQREPVPESPAETAGAAVTASVQPSASPDVTVPEETAVRASAVPTATGSPTPAPSPAPSPASTKGQSASTPSPSPAQTQATPAPSPTPELHGEAAWIGGESVNFRKEPDLSGEVIRRLQRGAKVERIETQGEWVYVRAGEELGYVHGDYVLEHEPPEPTKAITTKAPSRGELRILVKKSERLLELWQGENLLHAFSVGLGWAPEGHKQVEGDGKTPEGEYYVCVKNANSSFYLSLGVSYPNKADAAAALADGRIDQATHDRIAEAIDRGRKPDWYTPLGGEIMIHGCGGSNDWTAGCVAVDNDAMDILFDLCPVGTPILILP